MSDQHPPNSSPVNILVIEDNRNNLKYLSDILTEADYRVRPAESGELCLRSARAKAPDLILLDIKLPGMNGIEVCRQLKSDPETRDVPIIFISALNERGPKVSALEAGGNDYVTKPVEPELLLDRIHTHLHLQQLQHTLINKNIELLAEFEVRKQTEKEVAEKESRYRSLFESSADALSIIDPETGRFVDCNEAAVRLHDAGTRDNFIGTSPDRLSPEYQPGGELSSKLTMQHIQRALGESVARFEWMYSKSDGSLFPAQITLCPIEGKGRKHILAIGRDITERKKLEDKLWLRAQEAEKARQAMLYMLEDVNESAGIVERIKNEWVQIFDAVSDPIFSHDADFHIVRANRAYAESAGMNVEEVIGKLYWEVFPKGDGPLPGCVKALEKAEAAEEEEEEEEEIRLENGRIFLNHSYAMRQSGERHDSIHLMEDITERIQAKDALLESHQRLGKALEGSIAAIASAVEARDPYTAGHQRRVADLAAAIAQEMDLEKEQVEGIYMGASIHDIGKINLPAEILSKPSRLNEIEYSLIKGHPQVGYDILKEIEFPWPVADIAHQHHERLDGSGYPQGIRGEDICLEARIVAVADIIEAMSSHRPYRPGLGINAALKEIEAQIDKTLDGIVVRACLKLFREDQYSFEE